MREEFAFFIKDLIFSVIYVNLNEMKVLREILNLLIFFFLPFSFFLYSSVYLWKLYSQLFVTVFGKDNIFQRKVHKDF